MSPGIPHDVRRLLEERIESIRQLDVLLCLRESGSARTWTAAELNATLRSSETALEGDLAGLLDAGLVETVAGPPTQWRYAPGDQSRAVDQLAASYRSHRTTVIRTIGSGRATSIDEFADAFRIRRRDNPTDG